MSKEYLESLEKVYYGSQGYGDCDENYKIVKQALQRLESIDNAEPSNVSFIWLNQRITRLEDDLQHYTMVEKDKALASITEKELNHLTTIKQALLKAQEPKQYVDELKLVEKSLKALDIIKEKRVNVGTFIHLTKILKKDYEQCKALNNTFGANICEPEKEFLTEEEFSLLREILGC